MRPVDIKGQKFGRLTAIEPVLINPRRKWRFICECGNEPILISSPVIRGITQSCGCLQRELRARGNTKHGLCYTKAYSSWTQMKYRCLAPSAPNFKYYGGRGITICKEWKTDFQAFYTHIGEPPSSTHSVDRIDNDRGYEIGNVRWATPKEQARNKRTSRNRSTP